MKVIRPTVQWILIFGFISAIFSQNVNLSHSCCANGYTICETQIGKWILRLKRGLCESHAINGSRDIDFGLISAIFSQNVNLSQICWSKG